LMPARNFWHAAKYYDEGARAVVGEGVAFAYISDDTPCPHTHGYDARFRLYWSDAGPDDFDDLNLVDDIETAIYDLFGITRDNHLAALPTAFDNIVERDNFYDYKLPQVGLQLAGVYR